jgi:hypothetical protein
MPRSRGADRNRHAARCPRNQARPSPARFTNEAGGPFVSLVSGRWRSWSSSFPTRLRGAHQRRAPSAVDDPSGRGRGGGPEGPPLCCPAIRVRAHKRRRRSRLRVGARASLHPAMSDCAPYLQHKETRAYAVGCGKPPLHTRFRARGSLTIQGAAAGDAARARRAIEACADRQRPTPLSVTKI